MTTSSVCVYTHTPLLYMYVCIDHIFFIHSNGQTKQKESHRYREQTSGCQRVGGLRAWAMSEGGQEVQNSSYKANVMGM